jgi:hypothetical protein
MKIQNILRMQVAVIAVGAALLLAGAARAQEIDNPTFDQGQNSVPFAQKQATPAASAAKAMVGAATPTKQAAVIAPVNGNVSVATTDAVATQEGVVSVAPPMEGWMAAAFFFTIVLGIFYVRTDRRRRIGAVVVARASRVGRAIQES